jgi:hypothetical protein
MASGTDRVPEIRVTAASVLSTPVHDSGLKLEASAGPKRGP